MKGSINSFAAVALLMQCSLALAQSAPPSSIPRIGTAPHSANQTFKMLKGYFSNPVNFYQIASADERTHTIVARRSGIDSASWGQWAYCSLGPSHMFDTLRDSSVTLNIKIESSGSASVVTVTADFEGTYGIMSSQSTMQCTSKGVLEGNVLSIAGASPST